MSLEKKEVEDLLSELTRRLIDARVAIEAVAEKYTHSIWFDLYVSVWGKQARS